MNERPRSASFPQGLPPLRSEAEARGLPYCEDCRFYKAPTVAGQFGDARCARPRDLQPVELVAREARKPDAFCDMQRAPGAACGLAATFFKAKTDAVDA